MKINPAGQTEHLDEEQARLKKACQDLEGVFLRHLLQQMRKTVPQDGLLESSFAQKSYQDMMDGALVDGITRQGSFGLAEMLYRQLCPQEVSAPEERAAAGAAPEPALVAPVIPFLEELEELPSTHEAEEVDQ